VKYRGQDLVPLTEQDIVTEEKSVQSKLCPLTNENVIHLSQDKTEICADGKSENYSDVGSLNYDSFSKSGDDSLAYDDFNSAAGSLAYDDFNSVTGSLDYDSFSGKECSIDSSNSLIENSNNIGVDKYWFDKSHEDELCAAYDSFDAGYGSFSDIIHEDVMRQISPKGKFADTDVNSDTTTESQPPGFADRSQNISGQDSCSADKKYLDHLLPKPLSSGDT
jgi:hypothetical protein